LLSYHCQWGKGTCAGIVGVWDMGKVAG